MAVGCSSIITRKNEGLELLPSGQWGLLRPIFNKEGDITRITGAAAVASIQRKCVAMCV